MKTEPFKRSSRLADGCSLEVQWTQVPGWFDRRDQGILRSWHATILLFCHQYWNQRYHTDSKPIWIAGNASSIQALQFLLKMKCSETCEDPRSRIISFSALSLSDKNIMMTLLHQAVKTIFQGTENSWHFLTDFGRLLVVRSSTRSRSMPLVSHERWGALP